MLAIIMTLKLAPPKIIIHDENGHHHSAPLSVVRKVTLDDTPAQLGCFQPATVKKAY
jgi:hypothetical protein